MLSHRCLTSKSMTLTKDSPKLYKEQVKDRSRIRVKEKLSNDDISPFESLVCGDPYGNRNDILTFLNLWQCHSKPDFMRFSQNQIL